MPATLLSSGAVEFLPQEHTLCGLCRTPFLLCQCQGVTPGCNYILVGLPPPPHGTGTTQLIRRWCSIVAHSLSMGTFNADSWYNDNAENLIRSMVQRKDLLKEMINDYVASLSSEPSLPSLAQAVGGMTLKSKSSADHLRAVTAEARAALEIFLSGDWACLTWIGCMLLQNAFQSSNPQKYRLDDPHLTLIFQSGIGLLVSVMGLGFDGRGWQLAMESDRVPMGTMAAVASASNRLFSSQ